MSELNGGSPPGYVLFVWSPNGYSLRELEGDPPRVGQELEDNGRTLVITKLGASPLPGDTRVCAFSVGKA
jgi:hypothetical protein